MKIIDTATLQRLEELYKKVTPDWELNGNGYDVFGDSFSVRSIDPVGSAAEWANAQFAVHAQHMMPLLLDSVKRLKEALAIARSWLDHDDAISELAHEQDMARIRELVGE